ncbi:MAG: isopentenyl phosphate kinase [Promethearchaeota archaeon]
MKAENSVILLKLGGGLLTDKNKPFSIREDIVKSAVNQIIEANEKIILIHGGGSFGHPLAKKYSISNGFDKSIPNQILGVAETHHSMIKFNTYLVEQFLESNYPVLSIQTSSIFIKKADKISLESLDVLETALNLKIMPVLYGDILLDKSGSFSILSGDEIILKLCEGLKSFSISKVVFAMESDGLFKTDELGSENCNLLTECYSSELDDLILADLGQKIDVTGGITSKLAHIKKICEHKIPVQLLNGKIRGNIYKSLRNQKINCTNILINE